MWDRAWYRIEHEDRSIEAIDDRRFVGRHGRTGRRERGQRRGQEQRKGEPPPHGGSLARARERRDRDLLSGGTSPRADYFCAVSTYDVGVTPVVEHGRPSW